MKIYTFLLVLLSAASAQSQVGSVKSDSLGSFSLSSAPSLLFSRSASPESSLMPEANALAIVETPITPRSPRRVEHTVDKKFVMLFGLTTALMVTDIELTQHCLQAGTCHESNFLYGTNPTRTRMYGINVPVLSAQMVLSAWMKRRHPERNNWLMLPIANSVAHGVGAITGATK